MGKLKAPLFSLGASGSIGKALVYFPWKGINAVRSHVVPSNPQTTPQVTQRGYLTQVVDDVHAAQADAASPLLAVDVTAYAALASTLAGSMTWFNALVKQCIEQKVAALRYAIYTDGLFTPGVDQVTAHVEFLEETGAPNSITAGNWHYGTSPTALVNTVAATIVGNAANDVIAGLVTGTKYFFQLRSTSHNDYDGTRSGIYYATPT